MLRMLSEGFIAVVAMWCVSLVAEPSLNIIIDWTFQKEVRDQEKNECIKKKVPPVEDKIFNQNCNL